MTREEGLKHLQRARQQIDAEREKLRLRSISLADACYALSRMAITIDKAMEVLPPEARPVVTLCAGAQGKAEKIGC